MSLTTLLLGAEVTVTPDETISADGVGVVPIPGVIVASYLVPAMPGNPGFAVPCYSVMLADGDIIPCVPSGRLTMREIPQMPEWRPSAVTAPQPR